MKVIVVGADIVGLSARHPRALSTTGASLSRARHILVTSRIPLRDHRRSGLSTAF
jgi:hypothetical protein